MTDLIKEHSSMYIFVLFVHRSDVDAAAAEIFDRPMNRKKRRRFIYFCSFRSHSVTQSDYTMTNAQGGQS